MGQYYSEETTSLWPHVPLILDTTRRDAISPQWNSLKVKGCSWINVTSLPPENMLFSVLFSVWTVQRSAKVWPHFCPTGRGSKFELLPPPLLRPAADLSSRSVVMTMYLVQRVWPDLIVIVVLCVVYSTVCVCVWRRMSCNWFLRLPQRAPSDFRRHLFDSLDDFVRIKSHNC